MQPRWRRPESVLVVIHCADQVLLLRRVRPRGLWQSVTGSLEWHETPLQAARREVTEETGLPTDRLCDTGRINRFAIIPPWTERYAPDCKENCEYLFTLELSEPLEPQLSAEEHDAWQWLPWREAADMTHFSGNREAIEQLYR